MVNANIVGALVLVSLLSIAESISVDQVKDACRSQLESVRRVDQFQQFAHNLRDIAKVNGRQEVGPMRECLSQLDSINDLDALVNVGEKKDVCHKSHIDSVIEYHGKYEKELNNPQANFLVRSFFKQYVYAVSLTCNRNLYVNLLDADQIILGAEPEVSDSNDLSNTKPELPSQVPEEVIEEIQEMVNSLDEPNEVQLLSSMPKDYVLLRKVAINDRDDQNDSVEQCKEYAAYYENIISSIARLHHIGYAWEFNTIEFRHPAARLYSKETLTAMLKRWLMVTQMCDTTLNEYVEFTRKEDADKHPVSIRPRRLFDLKDNSIDASKVVVFERNNLEFKKAIADLIEGSVKAVPVEDNENELEENLSDETREFLTNLVTDGSSSTYDQADTQLTGLMRVKRGQTHYHDDQLSPLEEKFAPLVAVGYCLYKAGAYITLIEPTVKGVKHLNKRYKAYQVYKKNFEEEQEARKLKAEERKSRSESRKSEGHRKTITK